jgi:hypothetical protein
MSSAPSAPAGLSVRLWSARCSFPDRQVPWSSCVEGAEAIVAPAFPFGLSEDASTTLISLRSSDQYSNGAVVQASGSDARAPVEC